MVGKSNQLAHAAARAVADAPAESYNPLLIYGDSGLGKTHLIYAIAHSIRQHNPGAKIVYIKGDDFTNALIQAIREGKMDVWTDDFQKLTGQQPMTVLYMFQHSDQFQVGERHSKDN